MIVIWIFKKNPHNPLLNAIIKYKYHSTIGMIKSKIETESIFSVTLVQYEVFLEKLEI